MCELVCLVCNAVCYSLFVSIFISVSKIAIEYDIFPRSKFIESYITFRLVSYSVLPLRLYIWWIYHQFILRKEAEILNFQRDVRVFKFDLADSYVHWDATMPIANSFVCTKYRSLKMKSFNVSIFYIVNG